MTPSQKEIRALRKEVKSKVESGLLRAALERSPLTPGEIGTAVRLAKDKRHMNNLSVARQRVIKQALADAGWSENQIDFLISRSRSRIYRGIHTKEVPHDVV